MCDSYHRELMTPEINAQIEELIGELGAELGLQPGFYERLLNEQSDWAFLVQLQTVVEAAVADALVKALNEDRAFQHISRLNFDGRAGKLGLAQALGVLDSNSINALRALSACRNSFAHRTANIGTTLEAFSESLDAKSKLALVRKMGFIEADEETAERAAGFPGFGSKLRYRLWFSTACALACFANPRTRAKLVRLRRQLVHTERSHAQTSPGTPRTLPDFVAKNDVKR
jgi:hypothetical protein